MSYNHFSASFLCIFLHITALHISTKILHIKDITENISIIYHKNRASIGMAALFMQHLIGIFTLILFRVRIRRKSLLQSKRRL